MTDDTTTPAIAEPTTPTACSAQPFEGQTRIEIYPDGSCIGNPGDGGYGIVILRKDAGGQIIRTLEKSGWSTEVTTNNRMEITAACVALEALGSVTDEPITLFCDANAIPNAMNGWMEKWRARGWRTSSGKPVSNADLWQRLERAAEGRNVTWDWVRGHSGNAHNECADKLAYAAAERAEAYRKKLGRRVGT